MMKHHSTGFVVSIFALVALSSQVDAAFGIDVTLFGPKTYVRDGTKPVIITDMFPALQRDSNFHVIVQNGENAQTRVSSAIVRINDVPVLGPSDFNKQVARIDNSTRLLPTNTVQVELRSQQGSFLVIKVTAERQNVPPVADAGPNQTISVGTAVTLDGKASQDPDGDPISYQWSFVSKPVGSADVLSGETSEKATFIANVPGVYLAQLVVYDSYEYSTPASVQITAQMPTEGILLTGEPTAPAIQALIDMPPVAVDASQIENGVIMTRLDVRFRLDATVGQVNSALLQIGAGIVSMMPGVPTITIVIPRAVDLSALEDVIRTLNQLPWIRFVSMARENESKILPQYDPSVRLTGHLEPTRFPAAWNVKKIALNGCEFNRVPVLIPDNFIDPYPTEYTYRFPIEIPYFVAIPSTETGTKAHGYNVATTLGALFDPEDPTGANPFSNCLEVTGIRLSGLTPSEEMARIVHHLPESGKFIINFSWGYPDICHEQCALRDVDVNLIRPLKRAYDAVDWKLMTKPRWNDFLVATAAGNERNKESTAIYPGMGAAPYTSYISMATLTDPYFGPIQYPHLWSANPNYVGFPSLAATAADAISLTEHVQSLGLDTVGSEDNVLVTGSTSQHRDISLLIESDFSDSDPDVKAVGEDVYTLSGNKAGTSFTTPQVAGLASYLWLLSQDLRNLPVQYTRRAILTNARNNGLTTNIIDAYATVLSLDKAELPVDRSKAPIRFTLLDVNEDDKFDENDLTMFLDKYYDADGNPQEEDDCGRYDLNGNCYTGGSETERFDLDRAGSTQFGQSKYSVVDQKIGNVSVEFDENALTDLQILCYYAHSNLYGGDSAARGDLLKDRCTYLIAQLEFPTSMPSGGSGNLQIRAGYSMPNGSTKWAEGFDILIKVIGGTAEKWTGTTDAEGYFSTTIQHDGSSSSILVTVDITDGAGGKVTKTAGATISDSTSEIDANVATQVAHLYGECRHTDRLENVKEGKLSVSCVVPYNAEWIATTNSSLEVTSGSGTMQMTGSADISGSPFSSYLLDSYTDFNDNATAKPGGVKISVSTTHGIGPLPFRTSTEVITDITAYICGVSGTCVSHYFRCRSHALYDSGYSFVTDCRKDDVPVGISATWEEVLTEPGTVNVSGGVNATATTDSCPLAFGTVKVVAAFTP